MVKVDSRDYFAMAGSKYADEYLRTQLGKEMSLNLVYNIGIPDDKNFKFYGLSKVYTNPITM